MTRADVLVLVVTAAGLILLNVLGPVLERRGAQRIGDWR